MTIVPEFHCNYGERALQSELDALRKAPCGSRNAQLNRSAFALGQLVGAGALDKAPIEATLLDTARVIGLPSAEAEATIQSGITAGMAEPRRPLDNTVIPFAPGKAKARSKPGRKTQLTPVQRIAFARGFWDTGTPIAGTVAERYLREHRGIAADLGPDLARFHPAHRASPEATSAIPALLLKVTDGEGQFVGIQAIRLNAKTAAKIPMAAKVTNGVVAGSAVQLQAREDGPTWLGLIEGPEDALSIWQTTGGTVWACLGLSNIANAPVPPDATVILFRDNGSDQELQRTVDKLVKRGIAFRIATPPADCKDFNDALRQHGPEAIHKTIAEAVAPVDRSWTVDLIVNRDQEPRPILENCCIPLERDPAWTGVLGYNAFTCRITLRKPPPWHKGRGWQERDLADADILSATRWVQRQGIAAPPDTVGKAIQEVASRNVYHPVRDYLESLKWDGVPRIDRWLITYCGTKDTEYHRAVSSRFLISAVARIMKSGCKVDTVPILESPQGLKKSTVMKVLFGEEFFTDHLPDLSSKDAQIQLQGVWCCEIAELSAFGRAEIAKIKSFVSTATDRLRVPFGKVPQNFPRQCVFAATHNPENGYLKDATGARRFWPVTCNGVTAIGKIDVDGVARDRDQLWAEAVMRFRAGDSWWMDTPELEAMAAAEADDRYADDAWDSLIARYLRQERVPVKWDTYGQPTAWDWQDRAAPLTDVSVAEVLEQALGIDKRERWTQADQNRVARCLTSMGWMRRRVGTREARQWRYFAPLPRVPVSPSGTHTGTRKTPEISMPCPSVPVGPVDQEIAGRNDTITTDSEPVLSPVAINDSNQGEITIPVGKVCEGTRTTGTLGHEALKPLDSKDDPVSQSVSQYAGPSAGVSDWDTGPGEVRARSSDPLVEFDHPAFRHPSPFTGRS